MGMYSAIEVFDVRIPKEEVERFRVEKAKLEERMCEAEKEWHAGNTSIAKYISSASWFGHFTDINVDDNGKVTMERYNRKWWGYDAEHLYDWLAQFHAEGKIVYRFLEPEWPDDVVVKFDKDGWSELLIGITEYRTNEGSKELIPIKSKAMLILDRDTRHLIFKGDGQMNMKLTIAGKYCGKIDMLMPEEVSEKEAMRILKEYRDMLRIEEHEMEI